MLMKRLARRLALVSTAIAAILIVGTVGFTVIEGYAPFDAFYMSLVTITTVGYEELQELSRAGRIFNTFLMVFGVSVMFFAIGVMTQFSVELLVGPLTHRNVGRRSNRMLWIVRQNDFVEHAEILAE